MACLSFPCDLAWPAESLAARKPTADGDGCVPVCVCGVQCSAARTVLHAQRRCCMPPLYLPSNKWQLELGKAKQSSPQQRTRCVPACLLASRNAPRGKAMPVHSRSSRCWIACVQQQLFVDPQPRVVFLFLLRLVRVPVLFR